MSMWSNRQVRHIVATSAIVSGVVGMFVGGLIVGIAGPSEPARECPTVQCVQDYPDSLTGGMWPDDLEVEVTFTPDVTDPYARCKALMSVGEIPVTVGICTPEVAR